MPRWRSGPLEIRVPLKLVLAGEYAVLEDDGLALATAVDRFVRCEIRARISGVRLTAVGAAWPSLDVVGPEPDGRLTPHRISQLSADRYRFALRAARMAYSYVADLGLTLRPAEVRIDSRAGHARLNGTWVKLGLGTSAGTTVAVVAAVLALHGVPIDRRAYRNAVLRLSLVAHHRAQGGRGSGIDVAVSVLGGVIAYSPVKRAWLKQVLSRHRTPLELARLGWPGMRAESLRVPKRLKLMVGHAGEPASTVSRLRVYQAWKRRKTSQHKQFMRMTQKAVRLLRAGIESSDTRTMSRAVSWARDALLYLEKSANISIETPPLRDLANLAFQNGGMGKLSGAGGGDCGIGLTIHDAVFQRVTAAWQANGIQPVALRFERFGMRETRLDRAGRPNQVAQQDRLGRIDRTDPPAASSDAAPTDGAPTDAAPTGAAPTDTGTDPVEPMP